MTRLLLTLLLSACSDEAAPVSRDVPPRPNVPAAPTPADASSAAPTTPPVEAGGPAREQSIDAHARTSAKASDAPGAGTSEVGREQKREVAKPTLARPAKTSSTDAVSNSDASMSDTRPIDCKGPLILVKLENVERVGGIGTLGPESLDKEFKKRASVLKICYKRELRYQPSLQGTVLAEFTVEPSGIVSSAVAAGGSANHAGLDTCVTETAKKFRFTPGPQGGNASYRFTIGFTTPKGDPYRCWRE